MAQVPDVFMRCALDFIPVKALVTIIVEYMTHSTTAIGKVKYLERDPLRVQDFIPGLYVSWTSVSVNVCRVILSVPGAFKVLPSVRNPFRNMTGSVFLPPDRVVVVFSDGLQILEFDGQATMVLRRDSEADLSCIANVPGMKKVIVGHGQTLSWFDLEQTRWASSREDVQLPHTMTIRSCVCSTKYLYVVVTRQRDTPAFLVIDRRTRERIFIFPNVGCHMIQVGEYLVTCSARGRLQTFSAHPPWHIGAPRQEMWTCRPHAKVHRLTFDDVTQRLVFETKGGVIETLHQSKLNLK
jgi:hypothetical protein